MVLLLGKDYVHLFTLKQGDTIQLLQYGYQGVIKIESYIMFRLKLRLRKGHVIVALFTIACWLLQISAGSGSEVDSVTTRGILLEDSRAELDALINQRIVTGVDNANRRRDNYGRMDSDEFCDEEILYDELRKSIFDSFTASLGLKGYSLDRQLREVLGNQSYELPLSQSIYRDITLEEGISLNLKELTNAARVNGYLIGLDKIGHFFSEGWEYFDRVSNDQEPLDDALDWGETKESGLYGLTTTGIFSYADLVANFNGYRFWNRVLKRDRDPISPLYKNILQRPYVRCKLQIVDSIRYRKLVRVWQINSRFSISDYIDGAWDEGINCNRYKTSAIAEKVQKRIDEVRPGFHCPVEPEECIRAQRLYGSFSLKLLHPSCLNGSSVQQ